MKSAIWITLKYAVFASLWIILSDKVITWFSEDVGTLTIIASLKGLFFVIITSMLLFILISNEIRTKNSIIGELNENLTVKNQLIDELHHRIKNNIQVVLGVLNLESKARGYNEDVLRTISGRLLSMLSVYNVVYDNQNIMNISVTKILHEYSTVGSRAVRVTGGEIGTAVSVETAVTLLLLIDTIIEGIHEKGFDGTTEIDIPDDASVHIALPPGINDLDSVLGRNKTYTDLYAGTIKGTVSMISEEKALIRITYKDRSSLI